jgi:hypothetical protein
LLNRYAPALAKIGIFIDRSRTNAERSLCIVNARRYMQ